jgi:hypothetical protein
MPSSWAPLPVWSASGPVLIGHRQAREAKALGGGQPLRACWDATDAAYLATSYALELLVYPALYAIWRSRELPASDASASFAP